jgi:hypothetical protein
VLTPKLVGESIGLHPVLVIFAVMAGGQLFGFFGILLALPAAAVLSVFLRHFYADFIEDNYQINDDNPETGPDVADSTDEVNSENVTPDDEAGHSLSKHDPFDEDFLASD